MNRIEMLMTNAFRKMKRTCFVLIVLVAAFSASWSHSSRDAALGEFTQEPNFKSVDNGVEFAQFIWKIKDEPVAVSALRLDLKKVRLDVVHAFDKAIGVDKTSEIAKNKNAIAAINAGFFRLDKSFFAGDSVGVFQVDGKLLSESSNNRIAMLITNGKKETSVEFSHLETAIKLGYNTDAVLNVDGVNRERGKGQMIVYTPEFGATTPQTESAGAELTMKLECEKGRPACRGKLICVNEGKGGTVIPSGGIVVSLDDDMKEFAHHVRAIKSIKKDNFRLPFFVFDAGKEAVLKNLRKAEDIVAGVPQLIKNGKIDITWEQEKAGKAFAESRHPRTAVAKLKDGKFLMVAVDGRQPGYSVGMSLQELAEMLLEIGATDAMNLDGGGSTTMVLDGKVVNRPSDKEGERKVSDALIVTPRKK